MHTYEYVYMYVYTCVCMYIYREREIHTGARLQLRPPLPGVARDAVHL